MTTEKKQAVKPALKKARKAVWSALPWVCMWIGLTCWFSLLFICADQSAERANQLAALEAENAMYKSENAHLDDEIAWLRSLIEQEDGNGQTQ